MRLYLLRHGDAVEQGYDDAFRPLSETGEAQARTVAAFLEKYRHVPASILTSPLTRAMQMSLIIRELLNVTAWAPTEFLVPGTDHRRLFQELNKGAAGDSVLLVGHEPHLQLLTASLVGDRRYYAFRKSSMACVAVGTAVAAGAGTLEWLMSAEQMKQAL